MSTDNGFFANAVNRQQSTVNSPHPDGSPLTVVYRLLTVVCCPLTVVSCLLTNHTDYFFYADGAEIFTGLQCFKIIKCKRGCVNL